MFRRKKTDQVVQQPQVQTPGLSVTLPMYRIIRVRMAMLIVMFVLGVVTQFMMAIYTPTVWNYLYTVMKNITG